MSTTCSTCDAWLDVPVDVSAIDVIKAHVLAEHPEGLCVDGPITCPRPEECGICPAADRYRAKACTDDRHPVSVSSGSCPCGRFRIAGSDVAERLVDRLAVGLDVPHELLGGMVKQDNHWSRAALDDEMGQALADIEAEQA